MAKQQPASTENTQAGGASNVNPIDQLGAIQSIIMGPAMAEINNRLAQIEQRLTEQGQTVETEIGDLRSTMTQMLTEEIAKVQIQLTEQGQQHQEQFIQLSHTKVDRKALGSLLIEIGEKISQNE